MSALSRFEELVEKIVEGSLVGLLSAPVQPVEIAKRLARAIESERTIGVGRAIAPNDYTVYLTPDDFQRFKPIQRALERELEDYLREVARERHLSFLGRPSVRLESSEEVGRHQIRIAARMAERSAGGPAGDVGEHTQRFQAVPAAAAPSQPAAARPAEVGAYQLLSRSDGSRYPLVKPVVALGRALDNDVVLEDTRVSRYHAEVRLQSGRFYLRDLRSTNGTFLNGRLVVEEPLKPGDLISIGGLDLLFQAEPAQGSQRGS